jgi:hypothetical protein
MQNGREIHGESKLGADAGTGYIFASEYAEVKSEAIANFALATDKNLELASAEIAIGGEPSVNLGAEGEPRREVVEKRETPGVDVAARALYAEGTGTGVACKQIAEIDIDPGFVRQGFLRDQVEPVVCQARAKLLAGVASRKLNVEACGQSREAGGRRLLVKPPFHAKVRVAAARGAFGAYGSKDGEVRDVDVQFEIVGQAVIQFVVGGVLPQVGVLKLESVVFVEELEVEGSGFGDCRVIRVKRKLGQERLGEPKRAQEQRRESRWGMHG